MFCTVNYEARLEDGTVVSKSDGVEFTVKDGTVLAISELLQCILAFKGQYLMQEYCLTSRAILPCHIEGCQDYEEE